MNTLQLCDESESTYLKCIYSHAIEFDGMLHIGGERRLTNRIFDHRIFTNYNTNKFVLTGFI